MLLLLLQVEHDCFNCTATGMTADHGIDPANKELYLSDEDFQTAFAMDKDAFKARLTLDICLPRCTTREHFYGISAVLILIQCSAQLGIVCRESPSGVRCC